MSTIAEDIKPDTLALIESQANYLGISIDEYLRRLLPENELELGLRPGDDKDFEADMAAFAQDTSNGYDGTYSRKEIYSDHD
jgi:hypothetical protein